MDVVKPDSVPPFVAEAQRRYVENSENMQRLSESVRRILDMPPDEQKAWLDSMSDAQRVVLVVSLMCIAAVPPPTYEQLICDELNRRHGLYAGTDTVQNTPL